METHRLAPRGDKKVGSGRQQEGLAQKTFLFLFQPLFWLTKGGMGLKF